MEIAATPPTTPPTIAPVFELLVGEGEGGLVGDGWRMKTRLMARESHQDRALESLLKKWMRNRNRGERIGEMMLTTDALRFVVVPKVLVLEHVVISGTVEGKT